MLINLAFRGVVYSVLGLGVISCSSHMDGAASVGATPCDCGAEDAGPTSATSGDVSHLGSARRRERFTAPVLKEPSPFIPVLLFHAVCESTCSLPSEEYGVTQEDFASMLSQIRAQGYSSITSEDYVKAMSGDGSALPLRPILVTFDDGRLDAYTRADPILRDQEMQATMFIITSRQDTNAPGFMTWADVKAAQESGRWDIQLHAADGHTQIPTGVVNGDVVNGSFFGNRRYDPVTYSDASDHLEPHAAWSLRVTQDLAKGTNAIQQHLGGRVPVAFAVPYSDFGQVKSNDPLISSELRTLFDAKFAVWFTQDNAAASAATTSERGRYYIRKTTKVADVMGWLAKH